MLMRNSSFLVLNTCDKVKSDRRSIFGSCPFFEWEKTHSISEGCYAWDTSGPCEMEPQTSVGDSNEQLTASARRGTSQDGERKLISWAGCGFQCRKFIRLWFGKEIEYSDCGLLPLNTVQSGRCTPTFWKKILSFTEIMAFRIRTSCSLVNEYQCFGGIYFHSCLMPCDTIQSGREWNTFLDFTPLYYLLL